MQKVRWTIRIMASLLLALPLAASAAPTQFGAPAPAPIYPDIVTSSFYLPMRDGVRIAMQVSRPARNGRAVEGRFPVIWEASIALPPIPGKTPPRGEAFPDWARLSRAGYVIVTTARRGNGQSFGTRRSYHDREEAYDAYEITEWLARQPWSDGKIGMHGCSNTGEAVMHALTVAPPHLKAAWAGCFSWSKYDGLLRGGIVANWGAGPQRTMAEDIAQRPVDGDEDKALLRQAASEHQGGVDLRALMRSIPYRDSFSPLTRSRFAVEGSAGTYLDQIARSGIPLYIQGGWHDDFRAQAFVTLANLPGSHVIVGPWEHCRSDDFDTIAEAQRFFDYHLKGIDTGIASDPPVHVMVQGPASEGGGWRALAKWPMGDAPMRSLALGVAGKGGTLGFPAARAGTLQFTMDPDPSCPGPKVAPGMQAFIQPCHPSRGAVSFTAKPATTAYTILGHPVARLRVRASAPDANIFAYLEDVAPDGTVQVITEGRLKASLRALGTAPWKMGGLPWHRGFAEDAKPLTAGKSADMTFDLLPTAWVVSPGHRLQLSVAASDLRESNRLPAAAPVQLWIEAGRGGSTLDLPVSAR